MLENKQEIGTAQGQRPPSFPSSEDAPRTLYMRVTKPLSAEGPATEEPREFLKELKLMSLNSFS